MGLKAWFLFVCLLSVYFDAGFNGDEKERARRVWSLPRHLILSRMC